MNRELLYSFQAIVIAGALVGVTGRQTVHAGSVPKVSTPQGESNHFMSSENDELIQKGDPARGEKIYSADCSMCHQPNRAGIPPQIPSLIGVVDRLGEEKVRSVSKIGISDKTPPMPPHPDLTEANIDDLIAFLRAK